MPGQIDALKREIEKLKREARGQITESQFEERMQSNYWSASQVQEAQKGALKTTHQAHSNVLERQEQRLKKKYEAALAEIREEHEEAFNAAKREHAQALSNAKQEYENALSTTEAEQKQALDEIHEALEAEKSEVTRLSDELGIKQSESPGLKEELEDMNEEDYRLSEELKTEQGEVNRLSEELEAVNSALSELKDELQTEKDKVAGLETDLSRSQGSVRAEQDTSAKLKTELRAEKDRFSKALAEEQKKVERERKSLEERHEKLFIEAVRASVWEAMGLPPEEYSAELSDAVIIDAGSRQISKCYRKAIEAFFEKLGLGLGAWPVMRDGDVEASDADVARFLEQRFEALYIHIKLNEEKHVQALRELRMKVKQHGEALREKKAIQARASEIAVELSQRMNEHAELVRGNGAWLHVDALEAKLELAKETITFLKAQLENRRLPVEAFDKQLRKVGALAGISPAGE